MRRSKMKKWIIWLIVFFAFVNGLASACTVIMASKGGMVLVGNNEDWKNPNTRVWFIPASGEEYGRVCLGFDDGFAQGGMNDQGLFIDGNALSPTGWKADPATGASVVVEWGQGKVQYVKKIGVYQISTNFVFTNVKNHKYPCSRYNITEGLMMTAEKVSFDLIREVLSATHQEGRYPTVYSNICDLKNGTITIYNFHHFEETVTFNLAEELKKGRQTYELPALFSIQTQAARVFKSQQQVPAADVLYKTIQRQGVPKAIEKYQKMKTQFSKQYLYDFSESQINMLGYRLLNEGGLQDAISIFKLNVEEHPKSSNVYDSLGESYMKNGDRDLAIQNYKKSLDLNPNNENGQKMLEQLEKSE